MNKTPENSQNKSHSINAQQAPVVSGKKLRKLASQVELLAPAGGLAQLRAAVANGANAVYLGLDQFNARRRAENFTLENFPEAVELCHKNNVRIYVTLNTLIYPEEVAQVADYISAVARAGADALIVQDPGVAKIAAQIAPALELHASTQMTLTEPDAINRAADTLGIRRVILPRELSAAQIAQVASDAKIPVEAFIHGALCISYSGQCFASASIGGRSANRGRCAQPCRLPYDLISDESGEIATGHLLSPKDLCSIDQLEQLISAGATSLKIEGRLKSPTYVASVVNTYRKALDAIAAGEKYQPTPADIQALSKGFSRGFTRGYLRGQNHGQLISAATPAKTGELMGEILFVETDRITVALAPGKASQIAPGDGVAFADETLCDDSPGGRVYEVHKPAIQHRAGRENQLILTFDHNSDLLTRLTAQMKMWKTDDPQWRKKWEKTFSRIETQNPAWLDFTLEVSPDAPAILIAKDSRGYSVKVSSEQNLQVAKNKPATLEQVKKQLAKLGQTGFTARKISLVENRKRVEQASVMIPASLLNQLRRDAVEKLFAQVFPAKEIHSLAAPVADFSQEVKPESCNEKSLRVLVRNESQLNAVLKFHAESQSNFDAIYLDFPSMSNLKKSVAQVRDAGLLAGIAEPRIILPGDQAQLAKLSEMDCDLRLVRNLSELGASNSASERVADFSLNCTNSFSAKYLLSQGASLVTPGAELEKDALGEFVNQLPADSVELVCYGRIAMFHTQYCLWSDHLGTGQAYPDCGRFCKTANISLIDRKYEALPISRDLLGRTTIFSSKIRQLDASIYKDTLSVRALRIELTDEEPGAVFDILKSQI